MLRVMLVPASVALLSLSPAVEPDFDGDGRPDAVMALAGSEELALRHADGSEHGFFGPPIPLDGRITASAVGEVNRADGLADLVVAVEAAEGARLLVFEHPRGALRGPPEGIRLPCAARALALGRFDDDGLLDVAAACADEILLVRGRDRKLTIPGASESVRAPEVLRLPLEGRALALASGLFGSAGDPRDGLAILSDDGRIRIGRIAVGERVARFVASSVIEAPVRRVDSTVLMTGKVAPRPGTDLLVFERGGRDVWVVPSGGERIVRGPASPGPMAEIRAERTGPGALEEILFVLETGSTKPAPDSGSRAALVVDTVADGSDSAPGDGVCADVGGFCSLRAAIEEANALAGTDTITFALGGGTPTIAPSSPLPSISSALTVDGATGGATRVEISGGSAGPGAHGLQVSVGAAAVALRNVVVNGFDGDGIRIAGSNSVVEGCYVGTDALGGGAVAGNGGAGVRITGVGAQQNLVGGSTALARNVLSNNAGAGVVVEGGAKYNTISGNYIGTDASGIVPLANPEGLRLTGEADRNTVGGLTAVPGAPPGNVIAGNGSHGVFLTDSSYNLIQGNLIGVAADGSTRLGDGRIVLEDFVAYPWTASNTLGGSTELARNVFSGVSVRGFAADGNLLQGNYVGTDRSGSVALGGSCISITQRGTLSAGGISPAPGQPPGNVIAGCDADGIFVSGGDASGKSSVSVSGNLIGLAAGGAVALPNGGDGIRVAIGNLHVGGFESGSRNVISGNSGDGIDARTYGSCEIRSSLIGLDVTGSMTIPNGGNGVLLEHTDPAQSGGYGVVGGGGTAGNVIAGNTGHGILVRGQFANVDIMGNRVGVRPDGETAAGNAGDGILIEASAMASIGQKYGDPTTPCVGVCNVIAHNGGAGVRFPLVTSPLQARGNSIFANSGLGIDRLLSGVTANETGSNVNFPVLRSVRFLGGETVVRGTLDGIAGESFRIEVFSNDSADASGHGEGQTLRGWLLCTADTAGRCDWSVRFPGTATFVTAASTNGYQQTSEFSSVYDPFGDDDVDGIPNHSDNCPTASNPSQSDGDADGAGDACDSCPALFNDDQRDDDGDGIGNLCDNCPSTANAVQGDLDGDGRGDACDCQPEDAGDLRPEEVLGLVGSKAGGTATFTWNAVSGADVYSVQRGRISELRYGYGNCLANGLLSTSISDAGSAGEGDGYLYLVRAQNFECGLGTLGWTSSEVERISTACAGGTRTDVKASSETPVYGSVSGTFVATTTSNDVLQSISEEITGGTPSTRISRLEHRWTFLVPAGSRTEFHVEAFRTQSTDGDDFRFEYSTDGSSFTPIALPPLPFVDDDTDRVADLPAGLTGTVTIRVVDTDRTPGNRTSDTVSIDELFIRVVP